MILCVYYMSQLQRNWITTTNQNLCCFLSGICLQFTHSKMNTKSVALSETCSTSSTLTFLRDATHWMPLQWQPSLQRAGSCNYQQRYPFCCWWLPSLLTQPYSVERVREVSGSFKLLNSPCSCNVIISHLIQIDANFCFSLKDEKPDR